MGTRKKRHEDDHKPRRLKKRKKRKQTYVHPKGRFLTDKYILWGTLSPIKLPGGRLKRKHRSSTVSCGVGRRFKSPPVLRQRSHVALFSSPPKTQAHRSGLALALLPHSQYPELVWVFFTSESPSSATFFTTVSTCSAWITPNLSVRILSG